MFTRGATEKIKVLQSYFNTMLFRDMIEHYRISSPSEVVRYFLKRVMNNLTKPTSVNNIYNELKSQGLKVSKDSLYQWLDYACNIFLFHRVPKYTLSMVKERVMPAKYYVADVGQRNAVLLAQSEAEGKSLENIVYLMIVRSLDANGRVFYFSENNECDFVIQRGDSVSELIQVCWELNATNTEREVGGLLAAVGATNCKKCKIVTYNQGETLY